MTLRLASWADCAAWEALLLVKKQQSVDKKLGGLRATASLTGQPIAVLQDTCVRFPYLTHARRTLFHLQPFL